MNKYVTLKNAGDYTDFVFDIGPVRYVVVGSPDNTFQYTELHVGDDRWLRFVHDFDTGEPILSGVNGTAVTDKLVGTGFGDGTTGPVFNGQIVINKDDATSAIVTAVTDTELTLSVDIFPQATGTGQAFVIADKTRVATLARKFQDLMVEVAIEPWQENSFEIDCGIDITSFVATASW
jgi:hypothetical protein